MDTNWLFIRGWLMDQKIIAETMIIHSNWGKVSEANQPWFEHAHFTDFFECDGSTPLFTKLETASRDSQMARMWWTKNWFWWLVFWCLWPQNNNLHYATNFEQCHILWMSISKWFSSTKCRLIIWIIWFKWFVIWSMASLQFCLEDRIGKPHGLLTST